MVFNSAAIMPRVIMPGRKRLTPDGGVLPASGLLRKPSFVEEENQIAQPASATLSAAASSASQAGTPPTILTASSQPLDPSRVAHAGEQAHLAALAALCLQGDSRAWEALVRREQRRVYGLCYRFTGSASTAEDLTQEVFLKVYRNLQSFDPAKAGFGVWLTTLTRNLLVDHYRRSRLERASDSLDEPFGEESDGVTRADRLPDNGPGQEQHIAGLELRARVQAALARVTPELREAVILRDLQDMDYREIADVLGIPQGTVKSRISRGRAELARLLAGVEGQVS